jgi:diguanylate cyclase (GGDEF)-like protein
MQDRLIEGGSPIGFLRGAPPLSAALVVFSVAACALGRQPDAPELALPTLTTSQAAHSLPAEEARRGYPVRLRAVVTYYDPYTDPQRGAFFACDATGCICVLVVEVEGVVHSVERSGHNITLALALRDGMVRAIAPFEKGAAYARLIDSTVILHANAAPLWTKNRQMVGARLLFPSLDQLKIEEPSATDPFSLPVHTIDSLLRFTPDVAFVHRVRVKGQVTLQWPGQLFIQDGGQGLSIPTVQKTPLMPGDAVGVVGFPAMGDYTLMIEDAVFRREGGGQAVAAVFVTAQEAMKGDYDAKFVKIQVFLAVLPVGAKTGEIASWRVGSELQLTGVCSVQVDKYLSAEQEGAALPKSFRVLLPSPSDVRVLQAPSWWTASGILVVLAICVLAILVGILWVAALKRRVREGTETVRATLEATADGILVVDAAEKIVAYNRKFAAMWTVAEPILKLLDHHLMLDFVKSQLKDPEAFTNKVRAAYANTQAKTDDVIELKDGRVFERHSEPQTLQGKYVGRVWGYRDVTEAREWTRQLQDLASLDGLTGIRNRRAIFEFLSNELAREQRSGDSLTVIMADLDGFKKVNDYYGHAAGDAVLRESAQRLGSAVRVSDAVGRYGGEEFLIVLPGCDEDSARSRAEEFRCIVESRPVFWDMGEIGVACSFGVAWTRDGIYSMGSLLQEADAALYRAKQAGGNCVVMAKAARSQAGAVALDDAQQANEREPRQSSSWQASR